MSEMKIRKQIYAEDIMPHSAWDILAGDPASVMVDVRTKQEWDNIGVADLSGLGKNLVKIQWRVPPSMEINKKFGEEFSSEMERLGKGKDCKIIFTCRSGGRSSEAAEYTAMQGYKNCYNLLGGMEGFFSEQVEYSGWKNEGLPWKK